MAAIPGNGQHPSQGLGLHIECGRGGDGNLTRNKVNFYNDENSDTIIPIDSTARNGESVARRRFQKGSVFLNKTKTVWLGCIAEYVLDSHGVEKRKRKQVVLCPVKIGEKSHAKKRGAKDVAALS